MTPSVDKHLAELASQETAKLLESLDLGWRPLDSQACAALRFRRAVASTPALVGLIGGASSGKSTLFNSLLGRLVSRVSAHAHETLGPVAAVPQERADECSSWNQERLLFPGLNLTAWDNGQATVGEPGTVVVCDYPDGCLPGTVLLDLPDVTSKLSADEGSLARTLLPWFDGLIVVVDEERWFDETVFDRTADLARNFGPHIWVMFNRTERLDALTALEANTLTELATDRHATDSCISNHQGGQGYRSLDEETLSVVRGWLKCANVLDRRPQLEGHLHRRCAEVVRTNLARSQQHSMLTAAVDKQLASSVSATSLSVDLLTAEERTMLGLGRRLLPFYDVVRSVGQKLSGWGSPFTKRPPVEFEKREESLAQVLRKNLEQRFHHATNRVNRIIKESDYGESVGNDWTPQWSIPKFDEHEWAGRIRVHIDAWRAEAAQHGRRSDLAALSIGMPLLLADLLFLGGAGLTMTWATAWVAGFVGGKGMAGWVQKSAAFQNYQATVQAYQMLIRESLARQWEQNRTAMPRKHLDMADPILEALMVWSVDRPA